MSVPGGIARRWSQLTETPTLLSSSIGAGWRGFEFQEIAVPEAGTFEARTTPGDVVGIFQTCGPMKVRYGGPKTAFQNLPPDPQLALPGRAAAGAWQGAQRGLHLFIEVGTVERLNHQPFRPDAFPQLGGPNAVVAHLLHALHGDVQTGHPSGPILGEAIVTALLHHLLSGPGASRRSLRREELARGEFERVREWIEANLARPFSLEELANEVGVSVRHLHRAFPAATGLSPYKYILARRVERAKRLIQAGQLTLFDVAVAAGFCDQAHMAHTFRKLLGASPSQFCNKAR